MAGWLGRATIGVGLALYGWSMMLVELYLRGAPVPEGPDRGLTIFRKLVMARAAVGLGAAAVVAALVLAVLGRRQRAPAALAAVLGLGWLVLLALLWPV
jgi:hypothetical protein